MVEVDGKRGRSFAIRFRAYGKRRYVTTDATSRAEAETELANVLADVRRGIWQPPAVSPEPVEDEPEPTFHEFASAWVERRRQEVEARTVEFWKWALSCHLLRHFGPLRPSQITAEDRR